MTVRQSKIPAPGSAKVTINVTAMCNKPLANASFLGKEIDLLAIVVDRVNQSLNLRLVDAIVCDLTWLIDWFGCYSPLLAGHELLNLRLASIKLSSLITFVYFVYGFNFLYVGQRVLLVFV
jgi:hypothetical protein